MLPVAALYVDPSGPYGEIAAECFDAKRDARTFAEDMPVVAHPPCGPWGKLAWACKFQDPGAAIHAMHVVRRCGGVLEHPVGSKLFSQFGIEVPKAGEASVVDPWGGYVFRSPQIHWGHRAAKDTAFYICPGPERAGAPVSFLPPWPEQLGAVSFPVERMGKVERRLTPPALAHWLASVAYRAGCSDLDLWL